MLKTLQNDVVGHEQAPPPPKKVYGPQQTEKIILFLYHLFTILINFTRSWGYFFKNILLLSISGDTFKPLSSNKKMSRPCLHVAI